MRKKPFCLAERFFYALIRGQRDISADREIYPRTERYIRGQRDISADREIYPRTERYIRGQRDISADREKITSSPHRQIE
ncbi:hypothetical protein [Bacillus fonticola]|uniref:hypothetical protein n=1 Tax=Bacillus fonticola TaxID=2728853 RepID=UPI00147609B3|nr:hypothetical protein [Bacillus fonticola]